MQNTGYLFSKSFQNPLSGNFEPKKPSKKPPKTMKLQYIQSVDLERSKVFWWNFFTLQVMSGMEETSCTTVSDHPNLLRNKISLVCMFKKKILTSCIFA